MRKRILWLAVCILMVLTLVPLGSAFAATPYDTIRVKLSVGTPTSFSFFLDGNYSIEQSTSVPLDRQLYTIKVEGSALGLYIGSTRLYSGSSITLKQHTATSGLNNFIYLNNTQYNTYLKYLGDFIFTVSSGKVQVVNRVYLEDYLYGVVPYEMSDSWPIEALKAQAVAARSYAVKSISSTGAYDVGDTSSDQVYRGYNASYTNSIAAVNATSKQVVTYGGDGNIVTTYFSASNGGWTEIPLHAWSGGTDLSYYQIREDTYDAANTSSLYETVFFPSVIDATHPVTASANTSGTPNAANAVAYIKSRILASGQLASMGIDSMDDFELAGVDALEETPTPTAGTAPEPTPTEPPAETLEPAETPEVTPSPVETPEVTSLPAETPEVTPSPAETPEATPSPAATPEVAPLAIDGTESLQATPTPAETPEATPEPTETLSPTETLEPTPTPAPTSTPQPTPEAAPTLAPPAAHATMDALSAVSTLNAVKDSASSARLTWSAVSGAAGYEVFRSTSPDSGFTRQKTITGTSYTNSGLMPGQTYYFQVRAYTTAGSETVYGGFSPVASVAMPSLPAVSSLSATRHTDNAGLTWNAIPGVTGYEVYRSTSPSSGFSRQKVISSTSYTNTGLLPGQTYYFQVRAYVTVGSETVYGGFSPVAAAIDVELTGVTALTAHTPDTDGVYNDRHTAYSDIQCTDYIMARGTFTVNINGVPATVSNVDLDMRYFDASNGDSTYKVFNNSSLRLFVVKAETRSGVAGFSISQKRYGHGVGLSQRGAQQRAAAGQTCQQILSFYFPGTALTTLSVSKPAQTAKIWPTTTNATIVNTSDYVNVRSGPGTGYAAAGRLPGGARVQVTQLPGGTDWYAINYGGVKAYVHKDYIRMNLPGISGLSAARYSATSVNLTWKATPGVAGYEVYRSTSPDSGFSRQKVIATTSYINTGLIPGQTYYYQLRAYATVGSDTVYSDFSTVVSTTPGFAPITTLNAGQYNSTSAKLTWAAVSGAEGYEVFRSTSPSSGFSRQKTIIGTSYTNTGLVPGQTYYYQVRPYATVGGVQHYGNFSPVASVTTRFTAISTFTVALYSPSSAKLTWAAVSGAEGYEVFRSTSPSSGFTRQKSLASTNYINTGLYPGQTYYFQVRPYVTVGTERTYGSFSSVKSVATPAISTVSGLVVARNNGTSARLTWAAVSGTDGYEVFRSTSPSSGFARQKSLSATSYTNTGLYPGQTYYFQVRAYVTVGTERVYGHFSSVKGVAMPAISAVSGFSAARNNGTSARLTWAAVSGAEGYEVFRSTSPTSGFSRQKSLSSTAYTNTGLYPGQTYYFQVRAYVTVGTERAYGNFSPVKSVAMPALSAVSGFSAAVDTPTTARLTWTAVSGAGGYEVFRSASPTSGFTRQKSLAATRYTNTGLIPNQPYYYKARAYVTVGGARVYGTDSEVSSVIPTFSTVTGFGAARYNTTSVRLTWNAVPGAESYEVFRSVSPTDGFTRQKVITGATSYVNTGLASGTPYYYKIRAVATIGGTQVYGAYSNVVTGVSGFAGLIGATAASASVSSVQLTWSAVPGAEGYEVFRSVSPTDGFTRQKIITGATRYTNTGLMPGTEYFFRIRAFRTENEAQVYSTYSTVSAIPGLADVTGFKVARYSSTSAQLTWNAVPGAESYEVYRSVSASGGFSRQKIITSATRYINTGLVSGTTYYYQIRTVSTIGGTQVYGDYSNVASVRL